MEKMTISGESIDYGIVRSLNLMTVVMMVCDLTKPGLACSCFRKGRFWCSMASPSLYTGAQETSRHRVTARGTWLHC